MNSNDLKKLINGDDFEKIVADIYCGLKKEDIEEERERYIKLVNKAVSLYGEGDYHIISSPGRVEIGGNHTDHQKGQVIAASINLDNLCVVKARSDMKAKFYDDVFGMNEIDLTDLTIHEDEKGNTKSIIRGIAARYKDLSYAIGGFEACQDMKVLVGSGLSSSACFEILITEIYNYLYNEDKLGPIERAIISQWVENNFFGKPCGLMDQMAISVGSFVHIDFYNDKPKIRKNSFSFSDYGYKLLIVNTKGSHADLTAEYAAIPGEMKEIAKYFGEEYLSRVDENEFYKNIKDIRDKVKNDRAVLRAHHFFEENKRAEKLDKALSDYNIERVLSLMKESGESSYKYLQNVYAASDVKNQGIALALALSEKVIENDGICRVQGGGFAGTIQIVVENEKVSKVIENISEIFGKDSIIVAEIRNSGTKLIV